MKTTKLLASSAPLLLGFHASPGHAAAFSSGSTGADGPLNVTTVLQLQLPPDGVFNFTTIDIAQGATLSFRRNELNTPVYLLATSNVTINGSISVAGYPGLSSVGGEGGPGGFDGGNPSSGGVPPGDGYGPGGGTGGIFARGGTYATSYSTTSSNRYGNLLLQPLVGGSGGGGSAGTGGGGGGGAILIASSTQIAFGSSFPYPIVDADGGDASDSNNDGSGGAIRLVAPKVSGSGAGRLSALGRDSGGDGRIRVDTQDKRQMGLRLNGRASIGINMTVFSSPTARLDIVEVAGRPIPAGTNATVRIQLPLNSPTNQTVMLTATDFIGPVSLEVVVTPDNGPSQRFPATFDMGNSNQVTTTVNVIIPPDIPCRVNAWTR